jgi:hypothetical protein
MTRYTCGSRRELFKQMMAALYGRDYRSEADRQLGVHLRTLMRWDSGERPAPDAKLHILSVLLRQRRKHIDRLLDEHERQIDDRRNI